MGLSAPSFEILDILLSRADEVVGKGDLLDSVWPGRLPHARTPRRGARAAGAYSAGAPAGPPGDSQASRTQGRRIAAARSLSLISTGGLSDQALPLIISL